MNKSPLIKKLYWVLAKYGPNDSLVALLKGGKTFEEAVASTEGNYGHPSIIIIGPMTKRKAINKVKSIYA